MVKTSKLGINLLLGASSQDLDTWLITTMVIVSKSPRPGVVGPLPNGRFMTYKWGILITYKSWDDAPSIPFKSGIFR